MKGIWPLPPCRGFSLLEVMIAMVIMSFGLLGLVGLQTVSKYSSHESRQRTQAIWLATDMMERARVNQAIWRTQPPGTWTVTSTGSRARPNCAQDDGTMANCSAVELRNLDLYRWEQALQGAAISGAGSTLLQASGCLTLGTSGAVAVTVSWESREALSDAASATGQNACGNASAQRRQLVLSSTL